MKYKKILCQPLGWNYPQFIKIFEKLHKRKYFSEAEIVIFDKRIINYEKNFSHHAIKFSFIDVNEMKSDDKYDLNDMEAKYGIPNLNLISLMNYRDLNKNLSLKDYILFWEKYIKSYSPDLIFLSYPASVNSIVFYLVSRNLGIKVLLMSNVRLFNRAVIRDGKSLDSLFDRWPGLIQEYDKIKKNGISQIELKKYRSLINDINKKLPVPYYMNIKKKLGLRINDTLHDLNLSKLKRFFKYRYNKYFSYKGQNEISRSPFFFFPLHYEPEMALDLLAPFFRDQYSLIKYIHQSLPANYNLVIKEHPAMAGKRNARFFKGLNKLKNIVIANVEKSSYEFLTDEFCKGIITITSTTGFESMVFKKPVVTFGESFYSQGYDICKKVTDLTKLPQVLLDLKNWEYNEKKLLCFIHAIHNLSFEGFVGLDDKLPWTMADPNINAIVDEIKKKYPSN